MASGTSDTRPLSPHLSVWRWHATMLSSILHRFSGIVNYIGAIALTVWLVLLASGAEDAVAIFTSGSLSWLTAIGLIVLTWSASYHLLNGIRHLAWDIGKGFDPAGSNMRSILIIALSFVPPALIWFFALSGGAS
ncbi:succinate dehydrogenase, cytochrome b556 subunit [Hyphobacterium sp. HN65]|uniref:Succinate dehydrogenase cytochrome b556 subunit n=1 Tax=Hyphobacterium lacteum TaxID=3116575 RepID=A0ABU7LTQ9_9PROT|nr:succinate dehydrogenase, cytochrome b556 subunit [Hyphobacterium sp. HN65]MEE2527313.1 succinate dehydrogenase, cytochrome b556 subunit [Hyphobacterium sp. HN65]